MRVTIEIAGDLRAGMRREFRAGERAVTASMREAAEGAKLDFRAMTTAGGLGPRLARAWRSEVYPKGGDSLKAAALVWTKAPKLIRAFSENTLIRSKNGLFLAIPTENAPKKGVGGGKISPSNFPEGRYGRLRFVYRPGKPSLLVVDAVGVNKSGKIGRQRKNFGKTKAGNFRSGVTTVVMFILVPQVRLRKRIDIDSVARKWGSRLAGAIVRRWEAAARDGNGS